MPVLQSHLSFTRSDPLIQFHIPFSLYSLLPLLLLPLLIPTYSSLHKKSCPRAGAASIKGIDNKDLFRSDQLMDSLVGTS